MTPLQQFEEEVKRHLWNAEEIGNLAVANRITASLKSFTESLAVQVEAGKKTMEAANETKSSLGATYTIGFNAAKDEDAAIIRNSVL